MNLAAPMLTPRQAAACCPGGVHPYTIARWIRDGLTVAGRLVRLDADRVGGRWRIRPEALDAFIARTTAASLRHRPADGSPRPPRHVRPPHETASHRRAMASLAALGLLPQSMTPPKRSNP